MAKWGEGSITKNCKICGKSFLVYLAHIRRGRNAQCCSVACRSVARKQAPSRQTMLACQCKECGKNFEVRKGYGGTGDFCSIPCMAIWRGRVMSGEHHPGWKGGISERPYVSRSIIKKRIAAIGKCERCGSQQGLQGHHQRSYAGHPDGRFDGNNIEVLCIECHAKEHPKYAAMILSWRYRGY